MVAYPTSEPFSQVQYDSTATHLHSSTVWVSDEQQTPES